MLGEFEGTMVDAAAETTPVELPESPDLVPGTRLCWDCKYEEMADHPPCGVHGCRCPHCIHPEPSPGERLMASVQRSYEAHRLARTDAHPVRPLHLRLMAERWAMSVHERTSLLWTEGVTSPGYLRLRAAAQRQHKALLRLTAALERQAGGGS